MATAAEWGSALRPRTLPAALAPVLVGSGAAAGLHAFSPARAALAAVVALALQIGVNLANDYSDGVRGVDLDRVGPMRLTASGAAAPKQVRAAAFAAFALAALAGLGIIWLTGSWWLLAVGAACIAAAWCYTGGRRPYGYSGFGEVGVFVFFGLVATLGTLFVQAGRVTVPGVLAAAGIGLIACALLMVNNIRDLTSDAANNKRTLAVRLGDHRARRCYAAFIWLPILLGLVAALWAPWALAVTALVLPAAVLTTPVLAGLHGRALIPVLAGTGLYELGYGVLLAIALWVA